MRIMFGRRGNHTNDPLRRAVSAWRSERGPAERLSPAARERILRGAYEGTQVQDVTIPLFSPLRRKVVATMIPALLAFAVVALYPDRTGDGVQHRTSVCVGRNGDEVVFTIANGSRGHQVYKSSSSSDFRNAERISVHNGTFRDQLHDDAGLVFYRID